MQEVGLRGENVEFPMEVRSGSARVAFSREWLSGLLAVDLVPIQLVATQPPQVPLTG
jgi:hypothetical protein